MGSTTLFDVELINETGHVTMQEAILRPFWKSFGRTSRRLMASKNPLFLFRWHKCVAYLSLQTPAKKDLDLERFFGEIFGIELSSLKAFRRPWRPTLSMYI